jgi:hypothetical protein
MGIAEIHGTVHAEELLVTPFSATSCVYFMYKVEELRKSGKNSTRWVTIADGERFVRFWAKDETGRAQVDPTGADFTLNVHSEYRHSGGFLGGIKRFVDRLSDWNGSDQSIIDSMPINELERVDPGKLLNWYSIGDRRIREYCLEPEEKLFMIGSATDDPESPGEVIIKKGTNNPMFLIGDRGEKAMLSSLRGKWLTFFIVGFIAVVGGLALLLHKLGMLN